jgi:hypothetical protein
MSADQNRPETCDILHHRNLRARSDVSPLHMTERVIEVAGLRKEYRSAFGKPPITALDGIDFQIGAGAPGKRPPSRSFSD